MCNELRSGKLIGYFFAIPCSIVTLVSFYQSGNSLGFLLLAFVFGLGAAVGLNLLLHPKTLVSVNDNVLELYSGSLFRNNKLIVVPLDNLARFEVRTVTDLDGSSWILSLYLYQEQSISKEAKDWIASTVPDSVTRQASDTTIHWSLTWPEGGVKGAEQKLRELIGG
ncbi:hypothetical protein NT6N_28120 [Oceaniferula spumae]|uniref:DUF58 domain-containing protein n=1 Tax=Oceaniferula spumae TaxID=2979115 RepID=A0AAT9FPE1_9BACT